MSSRTPQQWANYWKRRYEAAEERNAALGRAVTEYVAAWRQFVRRTEFRDGFFEEHYDGHLDRATRELEAAADSVEVAS